MRKKALLLLLIAPLVAPTLARSQNHTDKEASNWWSNEYLRAQHEMDSYAERHHMTNAQATEMGIRKFNASLARRQTYLIQRRDNAAEAYGRAVAATPQAPLNRIRTLEAKLKDAQMAVDNGWKIIRAMRAQQAKRRAQGQLLDDMLNGR